MRRNIHIIIIEDEPATARHLEYILKEINPEIQITKCLQSIADATEWFTLNDNNYDLIFSDIRLSDGLSFEIFRKVNIKSLSSLLRHIMIMLLRPSVTMALITC